MCCVMMLGNLLIAQNSGMDDFMVTPVFEDPSQM